MTIKLRFIREPDWISDLIAYFSQGVYSHCDCILPDGDALGSRSDWVGGKPPGVQIRPPDYAKFATSLTLGLKVDTKKEDAFYDFLYKQIGKGYDKVGIWGIALGRDWREGDFWFCSELQAAALEYAQIVPRLVTPLNRVNPVTLATVVSAIGGFIE